ncbi:MAG: PleD family two-component system response regulator [Alphaproteobacteria bacterium]|nr:PleD family two-component system response regulator [Alphaproteobacteria bacterium]
MSALILLVDDHEKNIALLQTKLSNEFYSVITARNAYEALLLVKQRNPDLIILDVMMPGMDGFELCRRLKSDIATAHIPVIMLTALHSTSDRLRGLEAGADDFLTKPTNDVVFFARTKSLVRMKLLLDELRLRDKSAERIEGSQHGLNTFITNVAGAKVLLVDDDKVQSGVLMSKISELYHVEVSDDYEAAFDLAKQVDFDVVLVSANISGMEGLRLASHLKGHEDTRHIPVIIMVYEERVQTMLKALEFGVNDYLLLPVEHHEMMARIKTQVRRRKYQEALRNSYVGDASSVVQDELTTLYNRPFFDVHLEAHVEQAARFGKPLTMVMVDVDHMNSINQNYGREVGDELLQELSKVLVRSIRTADFAARFSGEEFIILLPYTDLLSASVVTDRIRKRVEATLFPVHHDIHAMNVTVSIGAAQLKKAENSVDFFKRVNDSLETAKKGGRNQVHLAPRN